MSTKSVILKLNHQFYHHQSLENLKIQKISSSISPISFIKLLKVADNKVNPRTATINSIVKSIEETLDESPELFFFKTKGILISTKTCNTLDRNRLQLSFDDTSTEGIMDGGHNTFAIARFIINKLFDKKYKFKEWKECKAFFSDDEKYNELIDLFEKRKDEDCFKFSIPIEIITPTLAEQGLADYYNNISEICSARNANVQLTEAARSNQIGCYKYLKDNLNKYPIIWKNGETGRIKAEDVVSLACLPLIKLNEEGYFDKLGLNIGKLSKVSLYSQKSKCISFFRNVITSSGISTPEKGQYWLENEVVKSALNLTEDIIKFTDKLYYMFPKLYNFNGGAFGRINGVIWDDKNPKYVGPFDTFDLKSEYKYAYGFYYPIICGLTELMKIEDEKVTWKINPLLINLDLQDNKMCFSQYMSIIRLLQYNPNKVGKEVAIYNEAETLMNKLK